MASPMRKAQNYPLVPVQKVSRSLSTSQNQSGQPLNEEQLQKMLGNVLDARKQERRKEKEQQEKNKTLQHAFKQSILQENNHQLDIMRKSILRDLGSMMEQRPRDRMCDPGRERQDFRSSGPLYNERNPWRDSYGQNTWMSGSNYGVPAIAYNPSPSPGLGQPRIEELEEGRSFPANLFNS